MSGLDWFPTLVAAAGDPNIIDELLKGKQLGDRTYKVHLDGYDQTDLLTGKGPSNRHEIFYFAESTLGAVRIDDYKFRFIDQPRAGSAARSSSIGRSSPISASIRSSGWGSQGQQWLVRLRTDWFIHEFWRFVFVQQEVGKCAQTFIDFPPMQRGASFNLEAVKAQIQEQIRQMKGKME